MKLYQTLESEEGTEFIQFVFLLPLVFMIAMICWQLFLIAQTISVGVNATRVGVRSLAVCGGSEAEAREWVEDVSPPGFQPVSIDIRPGTEGGASVVEATFPIPKIRIAVLSYIPLPDITLRATMRKEECR